MPRTTTETSFDVASPKILANLFEEKHLRRTIKRMRAWQDGENEVAHPLRRLILLCYEEELAEGLAASVVSGAWSPSPSYLLLVAKRSGTYRELAFPGLIDSIIGRRIIDALEPHITADDDDKVFFGRSHANADRQRGDYENWFKVWLDYSASIGEALKDDGFTYVFDTDITQFFPSVDRSRAKHALAQRTNAHQTLLELLFYCLDTWCPRMRYCPVPGLPIEPNDISRLVAHNYIKGVDEHFVNEEGLTYLRWVDDTVIFVQDEKKAHEAKLAHHLALREMGLSPNASKTSIVSASEYATRRHPEFNRRIDLAKESKDHELLNELVDAWFSRDFQSTPNWDKVATRLFSTALALKSEILRCRVVYCIASFPRLQRAAFRYLQLFELSQDELEGLLEVKSDRTSSVETRVEIIRFLCNVRIAGDTRHLAESAFGEIVSQDTQPGSGYVKALALLCLHKYGGSQLRRKVRRRLELADLQDDQLRLNYLYVFYCRGELDPELARAARHLDTPDISLAMRLCSDARKGKLTKHKKCLKACLGTIRGARTVRAEHLPFLHALLNADAKREVNLEWLRFVNAQERIKGVKDRTVREFLKEELTIAER